MTYRQTIDKNCSEIVPYWWPKYAYHFTDVSNIVSILSSGTLFSRAQAARRGLMENDNASKQVIDITAARIKSYVRFYFRPMTPTQYHNEGYKHPKLRFSGDQNANIPVPVFLAFDLEKLLKRDGVLFSPLGQSGHGSPLFRGEQEFAKLPFAEIYSNGWCEDDTWKYRHAEILCVDSYSIDEALKMILCRNGSEKYTLLNMLYDRSQKAYYKYKDLVRIAPYHVFQRNGLYVDTVNLISNNLAFEFASTPEKKNYARRSKIPESELDPIISTYHLQWFSKQNDLLYSTVIDQPLDYSNPKSVIIKLPAVHDAFLFKVTLLVEGKILCVHKQTINPYQML